MAYAYPADLVARYGAQELAQLSAPAGLDAGEIYQPAVQVALDSASALMDGYLRRRYAAPVSLPDGSVPIELVDGCCVLARFALAHGEQRAPTEQMTRARDATIAMLRALADGTMVLDPRVPTGAETGAMQADRARIFDVDTPDLIGAGDASGELVGAPFWNPTW